MSDWLSPNPPRIATPLAITKKNKMIIERIEIKELYGYLNKDITFYPDINLLVGINGSGKTSILNVINWIITPSIGSLCTHKFELLKLWFQIKGKTYTIECTQNEKELLISLKDLSNNKIYSQIQADFKIHPRQIKSENERISLEEEYKSLGPEPHEEEAWNFIFNYLPKPVVIGLDRQLYAEEGNETYVSIDSEGRKRRVRKARKNGMTPLDKVSELAGWEYSKYKNQILTLNDRLKSKLIMSSFDETLTEQSINELLSSPKLSINQVESLEEKVKNYLKENVIKTSKKTKDSDENKIKNYFTNLKSIIIRSKSEDDRFELLYITNLNQFRKLKELIKEFENFEKSSERLFKPIKNYLDTINSFLNDSSKDLFFNKDTSRLTFNILNKDKKVIEKDRRLSDLSSGEQQILILLTYIKFNSHLGKLFIIDEPELSLHPKWQEHFLEGIKSIMPGNTQLLFATHSPAIVGNNKEYCKVLMPY